MWSYLIFLVLYVAKNNIYSNEKKNLNYGLFYLSHKFRTLSCVPHWEVCCCYFFFPTVYVKYNFYPVLFGDVIPKYKNIHSLSTRNDTREGISAQDKFSFSSKKLDLQNLLELLVKILVYLCQLVTCELPTFLWSRLGQVQGTRSLPSCQYKHLFVSLLFFRQAI